MPALGAGRQVGARCRIYAKYMLESGAASALGVGGPRGDETLGRLVRVRGRGLRVRVRVRGTGRRRARLRVRQP